MKRKSLGKQSPAKKTRRLQLIGVTIVGLLALCAGWYALVTRIHYDQKVAQEALTYARIETYVNTAKVYLEQELPDGGWEIEKYCDAPNSKGSFDEYMCVYGVVATRDLGDMEAVKQAARRITGDGSIFVDSDKMAFSFNAAFDPNLPRSCGVTGWKEARGWLARIDCSAGSTTIRYELKQ